MQTPEKTKRDVLSDIADDILASSSGEDAVVAIESFRDLCFELAETSYEKLSARGMKLVNGGIAVSPNMAVSCLQDFERTRQFMGGLHDAIKAAQEKFSGEKIRVLYAGCGPFASLAIPLCAKFMPEEVEFTLLDIHEESLRIVRKIIKALELESYFPNIIQADAVTYHHKEKSLHIVVSETMMHGLFDEPQAQITVNLTPQLQPGGFLVPEKIELDAYLTPRGALRGRISDQRIPLGPVYELSQATRENAMDIAGNFEVPDIQTPHELRIATRIQVFGDRVIDENETTLTMPRMINGKILPSDSGKKLHFAYTPGADSETPVRSSLTPNVHPAEFS